MSPPRHCGTAYVIATNNRLTHAPMGLYWQLELQLLSTLQ